MALSSQNNNGPRTFLYKLFISLNVIHNHANHLPYFDISSHHTGPTAELLEGCQGRVVVAAPSVDTPWVPCYLLLATACEMEEETQYQFCRDHNQAGRCPSTLQLGCGLWRLGHWDTLLCTSQRGIDAGCSQEPIQCHWRCSHLTQDAGIVIAGTGISDPFPTHPQSTVYCFLAVFVCFYPFLVKNQGLTHNCYTEY